MDPPRPRVGRELVRGLTLKTLSEQQAQWSAPQIAVHTGLSLETVLSALRWLRGCGFCELAVWIGLQSLYEITDSGRDILAAGAQLALDV
jgi:hypothetical protein